MWVGTGRDGVGWGGVGWDDGVGLGHGGVTRLKYTKWRLCAGRSDLGGCGGVEE